MVRKVGSSGGGSGYGSLGRSYGYSSQLPSSDAGSTRSLGGRSYGSGGPTYGRQYSDSGGGFDSGSAYRAKPLDRSVSYASLSGSVSNLKDRYDRPSSSRDRYSSSERLSSRDGEHGGKASGYMSDVGSSRSYGSWDRSQRAPSVPRSTYGSYSRDSSPVRTTSRSSRYDYSSPKEKKYGGGGMDFGTSYAARPKSVADSSSYTRTRSSDLNVTPYSRNRTASMSDSRGYERQSSVDRSVRPAAVERQQSASSSYKRKPSTARDTAYSSKPPSSSAASRKPPQADSEESSESVSESEETRDPNYRYLVSRGTDPMDTEKERERDARRSYRKEKRSISRRKLKRYPKKLNRRMMHKPLVTDKGQQVNSEEFERHARRDRRDSRTGGSVPKYGGGGMNFGTSYSPKHTGSSSTSRTQSSFTPAKRQSSYSGASNRDEATSPPARHSSHTGEDARSSRTPSSPPGQPEADVPKQSAFRARVRRTSQSAQSDVGTDDPTSPKPKQSALIPKRPTWKRPVDPQPTTSDDDSQVASLTPENLSLKDSIDKVRTWKRQLSKNPPETPTSPHSLDLPDNMPNKPRSPRIPKLQKSYSAKKDPSFDTDSDDDMNKDFRKSELNMTQQQRMNAAKQKFNRAPKSPGAPLSPRKLCAGVPNFPTQDDSDSDEPFMLNVQGQRRAVKSRHEKLEQRNDDRSPSPYDNVQNKHPSRLKPRVVDRAERSPSPYDNMAPKESRSEGRRRGPKVVSRKQIPNYADDNASNLKRADSTASVSSLDTHAGSLQRRRLCKTQSMDSLTTNSSLPDIVPEGKHGHVFIGKVQDIDSLLGFTDDDEEPPSESEEEEEQVQGKSRRNQAKNRLAMINKNVMAPSKHKASATQKQLAKLQDAPPKPIRGSSSGKKFTFLHGGDKQKADAHRDGYVGRWRDVDELLGDETGDNRVRVLGAGGGAGGGGGQKLTLHIPQPQQHQQPDASPLLVGSSESLLDTPVPDTPDLPLAPLPAFAYNSPPSSAVSMENLNNSGFRFDGSQNRQRLNQQQRANKAKSVGNLGESIGPGGTVSSPTAQNVPIGNLVDLRSSPELAGKGGAAKEYPLNYSAAAIEEAKALRKKHGKLTMKDLLSVCRKNKLVKPPWVEDEEDHRFSGYKTLTEMLDDLGIDVKKHTR